MSLSGKITTFLGDVRRNKLRKTHRGDFLFLSLFYLHVLARKTHRSWNNLDNGVSCSGGFSGASGV